jgi:hypothetical protein
MSLMPWLVVVICRCLLQCTALQHDAYVLSNNHITPPLDMAPYGTSPLVDILPVISTITSTQIRSIALLRLSIFKSLHSPPKHRIPPRLLEHLIELIRIQPVLLHNLLRLQRKSLNDTLHLGTEEWHDIRIAQIDVGGYFVDAEGFAESLVLFGAEFFDFGDGADEHLDAAASCGFEELFGVWILYEGYFVHFDGGCHAIEVGLFHDLHQGCGAMG